MLVFALGGHGPSTTAVVLGLVVALIVLMLLASCRRVLVGVIGGAVSGAAIMWFVQKTASYDLFIGLTELYWCTIFALLGAASGGICAWLGKTWRPFES